MTHGRAQQQTVTIGGSRDGNVLAYRLEIVQDAGAYPRIGAMLPFLTILMTPGPYDIPQGRGGRARSVVTNTTPIGAYRGAGRPGGHGRARAGASTCSRPRSGWTRPRCGGATCCRRSPSRTRPRSARCTTAATTSAALDKALEAAGYDELRAEQAGRRARGDVVAARHRRWPATSRSPAAATSRAPPSENATVEVHPDGTATILTGTSPHGQGHATAWAMLASEELGIPVDKITLKWGDTDLIPEGGGTGGSRSLQQGGAAVQQASRELIDVARERAAAALEASAADLRFDVERGARSRWPATRTRSVPLAELAETERLFVRTVFTAPGATFPFGAHVAVVEVDTETGKAIAAPRDHRRRRRASCSTRCSPRASGTAASPRARRRRCWRRSSTTPTATR